MSLLSWLRIPVNGIQQRPGQAVPREAVFWCWCRLFYYGHILAQRFKEVLHQRRKFLATSVAHLETADGGKAGTHVEVIIRAVFAPVFLPAHIAMVICHLAPRFQIRDALRGSGVLAFFHLSPFLAASRHALRTPSLVQSMTVPSGT